MKKIYGILLIIAALAVFACVCVYLIKKGTYRKDLLGFFLDAYEFLIIIGASILLGIILILE